MATTAARKRKATKTRPHGFVLFNPLPSSGMNPPDFGLKRFTLAQQESQPTEPMTRVIKDVLKLGKWKVLDENGKPQMWDVTEQVLAVLLNTTKARLASGDVPNFGKSHGDEDLIIPTDELIAPIDDIQVKDGVLWVSSYVTPAQAEYLSNPARKVSVGVLENYLAGDGQQYPMALAHVAVTDRPIVTGQGRFLALANSSQGSSKMDFAALVEALNKLLASADLGSLPESVDETNLVVVIETMAAANGGADDTEEEAVAEDEEVPVMESADPMAGLAGGYGMSNKQSNNLAKTLAHLIDQKLKPVTDQLASLQSEKISNAKAAYEARLTELGKAGVAAITLTNKRTLGAKYGYDLALLDGIAPSITMTNKAKSIANGSAPDVPTDGPKMATDAEMAARIKARGGDPKYMPLAGL